MQIKFKNNYHVGLNLAIAYYNGSCSPPWQSEGWWVIEPGNTAYVLNTCNRYVCFYAEAFDGEYWGGPYQFEVAESAFNFCPTASVGFTGADAGFALLDNGIGGICWPWDSYTLNLNP
jgi:uncharacterized membrane protein